MPVLLAVPAKTVTAPSVGETCREKGSDLDHAPPQPTPHTHTHTLGVLAINRRANALPLYPQRYIQSFLHLQLSQKRTTDLKKNRSKNYHGHLQKRSCCCCLVVKSCPTLCDPMDCSPRGSSVHGISQARILEWVAILTANKRVKTYSNPSVNQGNAKQDGEIQFQTHSVVKNKWAKANVGEDGSQ